MKINDMKVGELYLAKRRMKLKCEKIKHFDKHAYIKEGENYRDWAGEHVRYPINSEYITTSYGLYSDIPIIPLIYLGWTMENWWLPRADWFPIRKRHWCMYKGRKMILDAWSAKNLMCVGE